MFCRVDWDIALWLVPGKPPPYPPAMPDEWLQLLGVKKSEPVVVAAVDVPPGKESGKWEVGVLEGDSYKLDRIFMVYVKKPIVVINSFELYKSH